MTKAKKVNVTLDSDKLHSILFDCEWDLADATTELIAALQADINLHSTSPLNGLCKAVEKLLQKRLDTISAGMLIDTLEKEL